MALKIVGCLSMSTIEKHCVTIPAVCVQVHMSDNRETMFEAGNSWSPVDVDNKDLLRDDIIGLSSFSRKR